jgi:hypothetical protein
VHGDWRARLGQCAKRDRTQFGPDGDRFGRHRHCELIGVLPVVFAAISARDDL